MKIAFVGKGGSGKSALTWLFAETLAKQGKTVYIIDADHNMDTAATFGITIRGETQTFHRSHTTIKYLLGLQAEAQWQTLLQSPEYPNAIPLNHPRLEPLWQDTTNARIRVGVVGLGADDILTSGKCAHGHSAPLKWLLPCLTPTANEVLLIDGVAGADMMNYGLFAGVDSLAIVAEHHPNSERVAEQIASLAEATKIPHLVIGNRSQPHVTGTIVATITHDSNIASFDYSNVSAEQTSIIQRIIHGIRPNAIINMKNSLSLVV
ncbi:MAG: AAA family ATPase [Candidatus Pacebacteria bacterium]|jgi:CO dehydrogenase maturation factor|nr:AAA family ATPase [Candidatus Paceibacterota bacterium]